MVLSLNHVCYLRNQVDNRSCCKYNLRLRRNIRSSFANK